MVTTAIQLSSSFNLIMETYKIRVYYNVWARNKYLWYEYSLEISPNVNSTRWSNFYMLKMLHTEKFIVVYEMLMVGLRCLEFICGNGAGISTVEENPRTVGCYRRTCRFGDSKIITNKCAAISEFGKDFPQISRSTITEIIRNCLVYHKICPRWRLKMLTMDHLTKQVSNFRVKGNVHWIGTKKGSPVIRLEKQRLMHALPYTKIDCYAAMNLQTEMTVH